MDPLSLVTACALMFRQSPDGLRCAPPIAVVTGHSVRQDQGQFGEAGPTKWRVEIAKAAARFRIPEAWISAVMNAESGGHTKLGGLPITSSAGAMGLMQLMPSTYEEMRQRYGLGTDAFNPNDNIIAGTAYLRSMYERYGYPHLFGAYNAGPGRYDAYILNGRPLPSETRDYVEKIVPGVTLKGEFHSRQAAGRVSGSVVKRAKIGTQNSLFFVKSGDEYAAKNADLTLVTHARNGRAEAALFVPLSGDLHKSEN